MKNGKFVIDSHVGFWDASLENTKNEYGLAFIETFYAFHTAFSPPDPEFAMEFDAAFRKTDPDWFLDQLFVRGEMDMAILHTQVLTDFYHTGFTQASRNAELIARAPERLIGLGGVDPRNPNVIEIMQQQVQEYGMKGFNWYTAEWRGESRGWKANDPAVFPCYEEAISLGIKNMHFHKGPAVEPLSMEKFDVYDIDEPSSLYPELNFIVDHIGLPRLDEFCWIAARSPNVYGSLAVASAFIHKRPRYFGEMMANLLFWIGEDRIIWGTDFPIWHPHWLLDEFMDYEIPADIAEEYGVQLTPEIKEKIVSTNIARLYNIDIEAKQSAIALDEFSQRRNEYVAGESERVGRGLSDGFARTN